MKASASLPFLFLFAASCNDATNAPTGIAAPTSASGVIEGNPPPPPVDAVVVVCTSGGCSAYDGTYMSGGANADALTLDLTALANGDGACTFDGPSWLRIDEFSGTGFPTGDATANARLKCSNGDATGTGRLTVGVVVIELDNVVFFNNDPACTGQCSTFIVNDDNNEQIAVGEVIEREFFEESCDIGEGGADCGEGGIS